MICVICVAIIIAVIIIVLKKKNADKSKVETVGEKSETVKVIAEAKSQFPMKVYWYEDGVKKQGTINMAQGIQIYNGSGGLIFDMSKNTTYVIGQASTNGASSGVINDERIQGTVWIAIIAKSVSNARFPIFSVTKGKISWRYWPYSEEPIANITFIYGRA